jgi:CRISPR/Cas system endoribonuclease Cas6 (RAMP superfamily)
MLNSSEYCRVSDYRLVSKRVSLKETCYSGFQGWVEYQCRGLNSENAIALAALSRLAGLTGTGNFTTWGLGVTQVKIIE